MYSCKLFSNNTTHSENRAPDALNGKGLARGQKDRNIMHDTETGLSVSFALTKDSLNLFVGCRFVSTGE